MKKPEKYFFDIILLIAALLLAACTGPQVRECPVGTQYLSDCPPLNAVNDEDVNVLYASRTWIPPRKLTIDPIKMGEDARIPVNEALAKVIGPTIDDALTSLAVKIWMVDNAQHTVDVMYFILERDRLGYALLGALCNAVRRGVDVRIMLPENPDHMLVYLASFSFLKETIPVGIKVYRYMGGFLHQKVFLVDDSLAGVGTANLDNRSFRLNFELTVLFADKNFATEVEVMLQQDFDCCRELSMDEINQRSWWFILATKIARLFSPVL